MDELFEHYRRSGDPADFQKLVRRHIGAIYSQCVRELGDPHLAEDVTQAVLIVFAAKARKLSSATAVGGWLFKAARFACIDARRAERRRKLHEHKAAEMRTEVRDDKSPRNGTWTDVEPLLNAAMERLGEKDRNVVLLRFFEQLPMAQVSQRLGISDEAARQRVSRAIQKLRHEFAALGLVLPEAALAAMLEKSAILPPPPSLAQHVADVIGTQSSADHLAAQKVLKKMTYAKAKSVVLLLLAFLLVGGMMEHLTGGGRQKHLRVAAVTPTTAPTTLPATLTQPGWLDLDRVHAHLRRVWQMITGN